MNDKMYSTDFCIPDGMRVYAIGDIHGHLAALDRMHDSISADLLDNPPDQVHIVYMGDYIDRGPDSKGVLDRLVERLGRKDGIQKTFLQGNHEGAMLEFLRAPEGAAGMMWLQWGGLETLQSYGFDFKGGVPVASELADISAALARVLPESHRSFLAALAGAIQIGGYFFAHAGVDPKRPFSQQDIEDLTFMREPFLSWPHTLEKMVVHGHSITPEPVVAAHRIGIDTGVYQPGGHLTAGVFERNTVRFLQVSPR
ncbi:MAG: metallophosphoesterase [Micavibrio sp.]|nr:metallophosphoesterase [Micavibrio sp.]|tara:strand:- start:2074 stop:2838 length:765 start_codon:yes stop_codon:yes gene_type:complete